MTASDPPSKRILLVEDEPRDCELLALACEHDGLDIEWKVADSCFHAASRIAAIASDTEPQPELIIMDLRLGDGASTDLLPTIARQLPDIPVIIFSTSSAPEDQARVEDYAQASYLVKPHSFGGYRQILDSIRAS